jgi:hypothetical protein
MPIFDKFPYSLRSQGDKIIKATAGIKQQGKINVSKSPLIILITAESIVSNISLTF